MDVERVKITHQKKTFFHLHPIFMVLNGFDKGFLHRQKKKKIASKLTDQRSFEKPTSSAAAAAVAVAAFV